MAGKQSHDSSHQQRIEDTLVRLKGSLYGVEIAQKFSTDSVKNFKTYCNDYVKNIKVGGFVEPTLDFPIRASVRLRDSLNAVMDPRSKSLMPTNNNELKGIIRNNNTVMISPVLASGRAPRRAAMKARAGCFSAFNLPQKLRRPTNFDPKSGVLLPTIPQTPEVVRKILDVGTNYDGDEDTGSAAPGGSTTYTTHHVSPESRKKGSEEVFKKPPVPLAEPQRVERPSRARSRRHNASQASSMDPAMELAAEVCRSKRVTRSRSNRSRRQEEDASETLTENTEVKSVERPSRTTRARSKMLKVPEDHIDKTSSTFLVEREQPMEVADDSDEEDTLASELPKTRGTYRIKLSKTNGERNVDAAAEEPQTKSQVPGECRSRGASPRPLRRSRSAPDLFNGGTVIIENDDIGVLRKRPSNVDDPMDTFDPLAADLTEVGAKTGLKRPSDEGPESKPKRSRTEDPAVGDIRLVLHDAPRTRSKHRAQTKNAQNQFKSVNKENDRIDIGQMMKAMERPGRLTPSKPLKIAKKKDVPKKIEEDPNKKKKDMLYQKTEEIKKNREMRERKAAELRAAAEREKQLQLEREQKEREERERLAKAEKQKQREEALMKKKLLNMQKAQEAEERRRKEEELRLARHKEQEEEQRRAAEAGQRQVEEAERLAALRKAQEKEEEALRLQQERLKEKERLKALKMGLQSKECVDPDDIGIADEDAEEADGKPPRRPTPKWAENPGRTQQLKIQSCIDSHLVFEFFDMKHETPDLREIFGSSALLRPRTSSAVWASTPPPPTSS